MARAARRPTPRAPMTRRAAPGDPAGRSTGAIPRAVCRRARTAWGHDSVVRAPAPRTTSAVAWATGRTAGTRASAVGRRSATDRRGGAARRWEDRVRVTRSAAAIRTSARTGSAPARPDSSCATGSAPRNARRGSRCATRSHAVAVGPVDFSHRPAMSRTRAAPARVYRRGAGAFASDAGTETIAALTRSATEATATAGFVRPRPAWRMGRIARNRRNAAGRWFAMRLAPQPPHAARRSARGAPATTTVAWSPGEGWPARRMSVARPGAACRKADRAPTMGSAARPTAPTAIAHEPLGKCESAHGAARTRRREGPARRRWATEDRAATKRRADEQGGLAWTRKPLTRSYAAYA